MNSILKVQNEKRQIDRLVAQRFIYSKAKKILTLNLILTIPIPILWSFLVFYCPELKIWAAFYGITLSFMDVAIFDPAQKSFKKQAAMIQELFDTDVLGLVWNEVKIGNRPDAEVIKELSDKFYRRQPDNLLRNWYPAAVEKVPLGIARLICQRANLWWDFELRREYALKMIVSIFLMSMLVFGVGLLGGLSLEKFILAVIAPLSPAFLWGFREYRRQNEAADALERLKKCVEALWSKAINATFTATQLEQESRIIQDEIFERRRNNPLILDWIYNRLRARQENQMNRGAEDLVAEALRTPSKEK